MGLEKGGAQLGGRDGLSKARSVAVLHQMFLVGYKGGKYQGEGATVEAQVHTFSNSLSSPINLQACADDRLLVGCLNLRKYFWINGVTLELHK